MLLCDAIREVQSRSFNFNMAYGIVRNRGIGFCIVTERFMRKIPEATYYYKKIGMKSRVDDSSAVQLQHQKT